MDVEGAAKGLIKRGALEDIVSRMNPSLVVAVASECALSNMFRLPRG
jgi:hypothetical protein